MVVRNIAIIILLYIITHPFPSYNEPNVHVPVLRWFSGRVHVFWVGHVPSRWERGVLGPVVARLLPGRIHVSHPAQGLPHQNAGRRVRPVGQRLVVVLSRV